MLDRFKHVPLYIQLKDELIDNIKNETWKVDAQIPTEKSLMEEYNLGRATVREAISLLVHEGYLYKKQGIGTFVARKQPCLGFEPIISLAYSLNAKGIEQKNIILEQKIITPDKKLSSLLKWKNKQRCFYMKRVRYAENIPVALEYSYFSDKFYEAAKDFDLTGSIAKIIVEELKVTICRVDQSIVLRVPTDEERALLKLDESIKVLSMDRWIFIEGSEDPYYYLNFIVPENIYSFPIEIL